MSDAYEDGLVLLARRSLTRHEIIERLSARGHDTPGIDAAVSRLAEAGLIDDMKLATGWIASTALTRGRGRERALATLVARGIDPGTAETAWAAAVRDGAVDDAALAAKAVRRRLGPAPGRADRARLARVYNALLSEGFESEQVASALSPYGFEGTD